MNTGQPEHKWVGQRIGLRFDQPIMQVIAGDSIQVAGVLLEVEWICDSRQYPNAVCLFASPGLLEIAFLEICFEDTQDYLEYFIK